MIAIIDYGLGNLGSVMNALNHLRIPATITNEPSVILQASGVILPGVGAAGEGMRLMREKKLDSVIHELVVKQKPLLGICLGMQLLMTHSEENNTDCLGIIPGQVNLFQSSSFKVPQIGWNTLSIQGKYKAHPFFNNVPANSYAYFVHSYYCVPDDGELVAAKTNYDSDFCSVAVKENIIAVQFHPEKSGAFGLHLLQNFGKMCKAVTKSDIQKSTN